MATPKLMNLLATKLEKHSFKLHFLCCIGVLGTAVSWYFISKLGQGSWLLFASGLIFTYLSLVSFPLIAILREFADGNDSHNIFEKWYISIFITTWYLMLFVVFPIAGILIALKV